MRRKILGPKRGERWEQSSRDKLYWNIRAISVEIRLKRVRFSGNVIRTETKRMNRRVWGGQRLKGKRKGR